jgi:hypothetical protein
MLSTFGDFKVLKNVNKLKLKHKLQKLGKNYLSCLLFYLFAFFNVPSKSGKIEFSHFKGARTCSFTNFKASQQIK